MGSMIVRSYLKRYDRDIDGLIVCGSPSKNPAAGLGDFLAGCIGLFRGQRYRSTFLANLCTGNNDKKFKDDGLRNAWLSTNKANVEAYNNDPLCGFPFTVNGYRNGLFRLMKDIYSPEGWNVTKPDLPIHFIAGAEDPCIISIKKFSEAVSFLRARGYRDVTSKVYPRMRHEILNEIGREDVWSDVRERLDGWLAR
jgi:alpha-beta hydrolase superfamily lysophospholipase